MNDPADIDRSRLIAALAVIETQQSAILAECEAIHGTLKYIHAMGMETRKAHRHRELESSRDGHRDEDGVREVDERQLEIESAIAKAQAKATLSPQAQKERQAARKRVKKGRRRG